ncbi:sugar ABC transporter permease [Mangrovactinospora gilvigrisea]|uniref:Sugar ABC transporter permease n=1 Tax=Mangrovactinospora gilvigrisea TaxID=1428644 RepID=A0A1J7BEX6_9ACTN|nr:ABC transporter permease [Mangrovactinospora gilvigrisea]OIV37190.1 sugar ABC transporter permease [Mangrovactinospora gilvigrisea]
MDREKLLLAVAAPVLALIATMVITAIVLLCSGKEPFGALRVMGTYLGYSDYQVNTLNQATTYYLGALAVAFGFRMKLFNIGVDGQYRIGAFFAAVAGGAVNLPAVLEIPMIMVVSMACAGLWAGIAGWLKVTRGVSEVITSIMLNAVAGSVIAYLLNPKRLALAVGNDVRTPKIPDSGHFFSFNLAGGQLWGFIIIAALVGIGFHLLLNRTRFGFDLRATGRSESAALASGVNVKRMVVVSMLVSGALAGLIGMPQLLNSSYQYSVDFPAGIGFTCIGIALVGRNNPVGIAFAALLFAFLDTVANPLQFNGYQVELVPVIEGTIVVCVVGTYEVVRRYGLRRQQSRVGEQLGRTGPTATDTAKGVAA